MKTKLILTLLCLTLGTADLLAQAGSGVYVGGHIRRARPTTIGTLRNSGFTYAILFNVNVEENGDLTVDNGGEAGGVICHEGEYVFNKVQRYYQDDVKNLKTAPTSIERIEICIGGWENQSYAHIRDLINSEGTGEESILYRNFKALKEALPEVDAVNNDDEHCYDTSTAVKFHAMMYELGYLTTVAPYTNKTFWNSLVTQLNRQHPGACDRVLIQCYDGGKYNNPSDWKLGNLPVHAGRTNYQTDMQTSINQMQTWKNNNGVVGGFVWLYNDESWNLNQWASAMNRVFPTRTVSNADAVATVYGDADYQGYAVRLPVGKYLTADLAVWGIAQKDIESLKVRNGYQITLYSVADPVKGERIKHTFTEDSPKLEYVGSNGLTTSYANRTLSLIIEKIPEVGITGVSTPASGEEQLYDLNGRRIDTPRQGQVIIKGNKKYARNTTE